MAPQDHTRTLVDLVEAYLESLRPQVHEILADYNRKVVIAYEAALGIAIPAADRANPAAVLEQLFHDVTDSALASRTPLDRYSEAGLTFSRLAAAGALGSQITFHLHEITDLRQKSVSAHVATLVALLRLLNGGSDPSTTMADVRKTGLYPSLPLEFEPFDHM